MTPKIETFIQTTTLQAPCLIVDLDVVEARYRTVAEGLPKADIYYAVKANPAPAILKRLVELGAKFDAASVPEIQACLDAGAKPQDISYGNTLKKAKDIAAAHALGVTLYAIDSDGELSKVAAHAPGAKVYCRILTENGHAEWPLSRKFGCDPDMAVDLLASCQGLGLDPYGLSFHVGSQQIEPGQWDLALTRAAQAYYQLAEMGVKLKMLNLGGGYPAHYRDDIAPFANYAIAIEDSLVRHFGEDMPAIMIEPGRSIVAEAGVIVSEVVLVAQKSKVDPKRWVYLDVGMFGGLAETLGEAIKYVFKTSRDDGPCGPVCIAGPTCDGADILYENTPYELPLDLQAGDRVLIEAAGAYTSTYASVNFNGFAPMTEHYI